MLENEPERVALLKGISEKKANDISKQLKESIGIRELMLYLSEFQISANTAVRIYKFLATEVLNILEIIHIHFVTMDLESALKWLI